jgi:uncharacterized protein
MSPSPIEIRGHHLLCILAYVGKGYTPAFVENYDAIVAQINRGAVTLKIVEGLDAICAALQKDKHICPDAAHCLTARVEQRDRTALQDINKLLNLSPPLVPSAQVRVTSDLVGQLRRFFATSEIRAACTECEWHSLCSAVATNGYTEVLLKPDDVVF